MQARYRGSCLCGAVTFQHEGDFERFFLCHCSHCRKDTGSAHAANLFSSSARLEWLTGQQQVRTWQLPGTRHVHGFCSTCGSAMPHVAGDHVVVPAGSLDTALTRAPDAHIFVASKAAWDHDLAGIPGFDTFPS